MSFAFIQFIKFIKINEVEEKCIQHIGLVFQGYRQIYILIYIIVVVDE